MKLNELINFLNDFARDNTFFSIVIIAIIANLSTELFKRLFFVISTSTKFLAKNTGKKSL